MREVTILRDRINDCIERMCEDYCCWPVACPTQERLKAHCDECPLNNILLDDYWKGEEE